MQKAASPRQIGHVDFASQDADYISQVVSKVIAPVTVTPVSGTRPIEYRSQYVSWSDFTIARNATATGLTIEPATEANIITCFIPRAGLSTIELADETLASEHNFIHLVSGRTLRRITLSPGRRQLLFMVTIGALEQRLTQTLGRSVKLLSDASLTLDARAPAGSALVNFSSVMLSTMQHVPAFETQDILMRRCRDAFVDLLCGALGAEQLSALTSREGLLSLSYVRAAEDFMEQNCHLPIGVTEVAEHLSVSIRTLQHAFKRHRERSPLETLTAYRLAGARSDILLRPDAKLADIAVAWGFPHLGRFASTFRHKFGETPRDLRKRARRQMGVD